MPAQPKKQYLSPFLFRQGHIQTILPSVFRAPNWQWAFREEINTHDNDFLELDWRTQSNTDSKSLLILSHGLEGHSNRAYITGMAKHFYSQGMDICAWNFRGCGNKLNNNASYYHSGLSQDLESVIQHAITKGYQTIHLVGFSMGGNVTLKYLANHQVAPHVKSASCFSVPVDLQACADRLQKSFNQIYMKRFLKDLKEKLELKQKIYPDLIDISDYHTVKDFYDFDGRYTAPMFGYDSAEHYWAENSSLPLLHKITVPCQLVNALDDPFLDHRCYPDQKTANNVQLVYPKHGGHVGWARWNMKKALWSEEIALEFALNNKA
jgi:uncharacterized protein